MYFRHDMLLVIVEVNK